MIVAERAARIAAESELSHARAEAANAQADLTSSEALIAHLKRIHPVRAALRRGVLRAENSAYEQSYALCLWAA